MPDSATQDRPFLPPMAQVAILALFVGGVCGYFIRIWHVASTPVASLAGSSPQSGPGANSGGGGMMGGGGGRGGMMGGGGGGRPGGGMMGGGGGGMMGGGAPAHGQELATLVRGIDLMEKAQGHGLTADQKSSLKPLLEPFKGVIKISDDTAEKTLDKINAVLKPDQQDVVKALVPGRGGRGGGGMMGGGRRPGGGMMGGMMGGGGGMMGGMMGGRPGAASPGAGGGRPGSAPGGPPAGGMGGGRSGGGMMGGGGGMMGMMGGGMMGGGGFGGGNADPDHPFGTKVSKDALDDLLDRLNKA